MLRVGLKTEMRSWVSRTGTSRSWWTSLVMEVAVREVTITMAWTMGGMQGARFAIKLQIVVVQNCNLNY